MSATAAGPMLPEIKNPDIRAQIMRALSTYKQPNAASVARVADEYFVTADQVKALALKHGWPNPGAMGRAASALERIAAGPPPVPDPPRPPAQAAGPSRLPAAVPPASPARPQVDLDKPMGGPAAVPPAPPAQAAQPDQVEALLAAGRKSGKARTRKLADKAEDFLAQLRTAVYAEEAERRAERVLAERRAALERKAAELREQLEQVADELKTTGKLTSSGSGSSALRPRGYTAKVRAWARENGYEVAERGQIVAEIQEAYAKAQTAGAA